MKMRSQENFLLAAAVLVVVLGDVESALTSDSLALAPSSNPVPDECVCANHVLVSLSQVCWWCYVLASVGGCVDGDVVLLSLATAFLFPAPLLGFFCVVPVFASPNRSESRHPLRRGLK